jgi:hypothetical protein
MNARLRTITAWAALAVFGAIALAGQGLHLIPGMGHGCGDSSCGDSQCGDRLCSLDVQAALEAEGLQPAAPQAHHGCCCGHHHAAEQPAPPTNHDGELTALPSLANGLDCPICRFFATTKPLLAAVAEAELSQAVSPVRSLDAPARPINRAAVYRSRAPPLG